MSSIDMIGSIKVSQQTILDHFEAQGMDAIQMAVDYILAWADAVPVGTQSLFAKMKCDLFEGPCGCKPHTFHSKCKGPYLQVPVEIVLEVLKCGLVDTVKGEMLPAPSVHMDETGHMVLTMFQGPKKGWDGEPAQSMYVTKMG